MLPMKYLIQPATATFTSPKEISKIASSKTPKPQVQLSTSAHPSAQTQLHQTKDIPAKLPHAPISNPTTFIYPNSHHGEKESPSAALDSLLKLNSGYRRYSYMPTESPAIYILRLSVYEPIS